MEKYLLTYAEPEIAALTGMLDAIAEQQPWANVVVIPACNESADFLCTPPDCAGRSLMILVINQSITAPKKVSVRNQALANNVQERFELLWQSDPKFAGFGLSLFRDAHTTRDVLLVDRFSEGCQLPVKGGVGHARKLGADLATSLIHRKHIRSPWIHCTDADVQLPDLYFICSESLASKSSAIAALIYPFEHCDDPDQSESKKVVLATQLYEHSLRYYVAGMRFTASPYAFHTIGSIMAVNAHHYAKVRGFPKRDAGEDFYLLNKLAKLGSVLEIDAGRACKPILIEARKSDRVPFGTGAAVCKITDLDLPRRDFGFYDPAVFQLLRVWLESLPAVWQSGCCDLNEDTLSVCSHEQEGGNQDLNAGLQSLLMGLEQIKTGRALAHAFRQSKDLQQFERQMHTWFDAFRSLKLIHFLRDNGLPAINFAALEANQTYCHLLSTDPELLSSHKKLLRIFSVLSC